MNYSYFVQPETRFEPSSIFYIFFHSELGRSNSFAATFKAGVGTTVRGKSPQRRRVRRTENKIFVPRERRAHACVFPCPWNDISSWANIGLTLPKWYQIAWMLCQCERSLTFTDPIKKILQFPISFIYKYKYCTSVICSVSLSIRTVKENTLWQKMD